MSTYFECSGISTIEITVNMSQSVNKFRQYTVGDNTEIDETYRTLTFTASPAPENNLTIRYTYEARTNRDFEGFTDWFTTYAIVILNAGQTTVTQDVTIDKKICSTSSDSEYYLTPVQ